MKRFFAVIAGAALALAWSSGASASANAPVLRARPVANGAVLPAGATRLVNDAVAYRPASAPSGALPLVIMLHGAGGFQPSFIQAMEPEVNRRGLILLIPHSFGPTWDIIGNVASSRDPWRGIDAQRLDQSLADLFARAEVDPSRVVLLGFSDGASYALSLGLANPQLFTAIIALSPGLLLPPKRAKPTQHVFVAHGRKDRILPFNNSRDELIPTLRHLGVDLRFRAFDGDHEIDRAVLAEALDFAIPAHQP